MMSLKKIFSVLVAVIIFAASTQIITPILKYSGAFLLMGLGVEGGERTMSNLEAVANILGLVLSFMLARYLYKKSAKKQQASNDSTR